MGSISTKIKVVTVAESTRMIGKIGGSLQVQVRREREREERSVTHAREWHVGYKTLKLLPRPKPKPEPDPDPDPPPMTFLKTFQNHAQISSSATTMFTEEQTEEGRVVSANSSRGQLLLNRVFAMGSSDLRVKFGWNEDINVKGRKVRKLGMFEELGLGLPTQAQIQIERQSKYGSSIWRIDVGMSSGVLNSRPEVLEIIDNKARVIVSKRDMRNELEVVDYI
ncbi:hypothetical protein GIB67_038924 [Kingdonia uniflora]|uniref:Uncharacterized protein n=1 Tax=Kingdonia uniflora TaxID=39325 RepID=A0A7J7LQ88_9MAGN|nr:hypothetical protein GIB67_038924 [Kingdonia uniflora]